MKKWYKYRLVEGPGQIKRLGFYQDYDDHVTAAGGYDVDPSYQSKEAFWSEHLRERFKAYDSFLTRHLADPSSRILSIASGRCINESRFLDKGYDILCTDLQNISTYEQTKKLFPNFKFKPLNILEDAADQKFDTVLCLSLIYLFDEKTLVLFFKKVAEHLGKNGTLLLDSAGSEDNPLSWFIHDVWLKAEFYLRYLAVNAGGKSQTLTIQDHGFRHSDTDIIDAAKKAGLILEDQANYEFFQELNRSPLIRSWIKKSENFQKLAEKIGKKVPYVRMFKFKKID